MASLFRDKFFKAYGSIAAHYQRHSRTTIIFTSIVLISLGLAPSAYRDYRTFLSYGPGGVPYNLVGWLFTTLFLGPLGSEMLSIGIYEQSEDESTWLPARGLVAREGGRPVIGPHVVPQRQLSQIPDKHVQEKLVAAYQTLSSQNQHLVRLAPSKLEKHTDALFLSDTIVPSTIAREMNGEVSHIHGTSDHSVHVTLSPSDCKTVIEAGWGQRHPLDGSKVVKRLIGISLPNQYILIYAPRNEKEIETVMQIVKASVGYMTDTPLSSIH